MCVDSTNSNRNWIDLIELDYLTNSNRNWIDSIESDDLTNSNRNWIDSIKSDDVKVLNLFITGDPIEETINQ